MTTTIAAKQPYEIHVSVPVFDDAGVLSSPRFATFVDNGLTAEDRIAIASPALRVSLTLFVLLERIIVGGILVAGAVSIFTFGRDARWVFAAGIVLLLLGAGIRTGIHLRKTRARLEVLASRLTANGTLRTPDIGVKQDIGRIDAVLQALHGRGDTSLDDQARDAVNKVLRQYDNEPTLKQSKIAASTAIDEATTAIRAAVAEQNAQLAADVAAAELAVAGLEAAFAGTRHE